MRQLCPQDRAVQGTGQPRVRAAITAVPSEDLDIGTLRNRLNDRVVGSRIVYYEVLGSTMDEARRLADQRSPEGTVVIAEQQTGGRGRFDRPWLSPQGENLLFSVLLRPGAAELRYVNMAATLAVAGAIAELTGSPRLPSGRTTLSSKVARSQVSSWRLRSRGESPDTPSSE